MTKKEFGTRLAQARQLKNISAYELSLRVGKSTGYMHLLETGKMNVSVEMLFKICEILEISPKSLFE